MPLLDTDDAELQRAALEIISRHEGWAASTLRKNQLARLAGNVAQSGTMSIRLLLPAFSKSQSDEVGARLAISLKLSPGAEALSLAELDKALQGFTPEPQNDAAHVRNFCDAIRKSAKLNADALTGHLSSSLCHLGNIATLLGRSLKFDPQTEQIVGDDEANALVRRKYREHWGAPRGV